MHSRDYFTDNLKKYLPENSINSIVDLIFKYKIHLKITKARSSKLGDYRPPIRTKFHQISVNEDLGKYHFLIVLLHEIAHLIVWEQHYRKALPHGKEWKAEFKKIILPFLNLSIFPEEILEALIVFVKSSFSSSNAELNLNRALKKDLNGSDILIEDIPDNTVFSYSGTKTFVRLQTVKKRIKCRCLENNRMYLFNPLTKIILIDK
ncbi:MAG: SprT-like domain-containing protein [Bacteroidetes bacterium]|nr:SprT-like domain-containing protein [Bacteroidota bacterium]